MPKVGKRHFPYTEKGYQEAREYAQKTGQKVTNTKPARGRKAGRGKRGRT